MSACPPPGGYPRSTPRKAWYSHQKQHLEGWLAEYNGPGAYNRTTHDGTARDSYQRFRCVAGLLWLAEALGESPDVLRSAVADIDAAGANLSSQCAAFRRAVPWERIEDLLRERKPTPRRRGLHLLRGIVSSGGPVRALLRSSRKE